MNEKLKLKLHKPFVTSRSAGFLEVCGFSAAADGADYRVGDFQTRRYSGSADAPPAAVGNAAS